ncbi:ribokinase [Bacillus sp. 1P10SD]|uniref:ribokinase n=1 Tax=Bacillus sp. 1P10SD TaxID=3132265 RepID=UPI0039A452D2
MDTNVYKPKVTVVGSVNMDLVVEATRFPIKGETILGKSFKQFPGGKGANQAVAAARLGADVSFIGCIGNDAFGSGLKSQLVKENIHVNGLFTTPEEPTGIAQITISEEDNTIIVISGANYQLTKEWVEKNRSLITEADVVLTQLEIPVEIVEQVVGIAYENNVPVILNPAPAQILSTNLLNKITYLTPNESELSLLTMMSGEDIPEKIEVLQRKGVKNVVVTRGAKGVAFKRMNDNQVTYKESRKVDVVDSTGAGDTFNGALAVGIGLGKPLKDAIEFSIKVAALSVTKLGAQSGLPYLHELYE